MALTATANRSTRHLIINSLEMIRCHEIIHLPNNPYIYYCVLEKPDCCIDMLQPLIDDLCSNGINTDRSIVFWTYEDSFILFQTMILELNSRNSLYAYNNKGKRGRLCDKFDGCTAESTKVRILADFTDPCGFIRVIFATVAFGMGIDSPNIRKIIHWGPPSDIELYFQETGRAGRDHNKAQAIFYYRKRDLSGKISDGMKSYC